VIIEFSTLVDLQSDEKLDDHGARGGAGGGWSGQGEGVSELEEIAAELYALPPAGFTAARDERARQARAAGDRELATAVKGLRRPTVGAWAVNLLAQAAPDSLAEVFALAEELRDAQVSRQGDVLRTLMRRRQQVLAAAVRDARELAAEAGQPLADEAALQVERTLVAALSDPDAAEQVRAGRLATALEYAGFGELPAAALTLVPPHRPERRPSPSSGRPRAEPATEPKPEPTPAGRSEPTPEAEDDGLSAEERRAQREERRRLRADLTAAERALADVAEQLERTREDRADADAERKEAVARREELHRELTALATRITAAEREARDAVRRASTLERDLTAKQRRVDSLRAELS
jgi:hypothetical protein